MTALELINKLKEYPGDVKIVVCGYENGFDEIETVKNVSLILRPNKEWWDGKYDESKNENSIKAIALLCDRR